VLVPCELRSVAISFWYKGSQNLKILLNVKIHIDLSPRTYPPSWRGVGDIQVMVQWLKVRCVAILA
jgi:hypothetical protein